MLKIRRPLGRLIFNMGIAIPGKTVFLIETAPWVFVRGIHQSLVGFPHKGAVMWSFDVSFVVSLISKPLNKQSWGHKIVLPERSVMKDGSVTSVTDGLVHDCSIYSALTMEILQSCTKPSIYSLSACMF